jgi:TRAP-type C4-dicarboxylate transport system permease small subunit
MSETETGGEGALRAGTLPETLVERICRAACEVALLAMVVLISAEVGARSVGFSFEFVDEIGGYLLSALTFLSLPVALVGGAYHKVEYVRQRLGRNNRAVVAIAFTLLSLLFAAVLLWQLWRLVYRSLASNVVAPTILGTPLWLPQSAMLIAVACLIFSLLRVLLAEVQALRGTAAGRGETHG